jgi:nucleotide-binding universal stress UspA family protein
MLHPPASSAERKAVRAEAALTEMVGSIVVVFSEEIHSEHMMVLAARLAHRERAELLAVYVIEMPLVLPLEAVPAEAEREALDVLATANAIALRNGASLRTLIVPARQISQKVLEIARDEGAHLIVLGSYREGKYSGAPLGRAIEQIASNAKCDVLIGVQGQHGTLFVTEEGGAPATVGADR